MVKIDNEILEIDFSILEEYFKAVEKAILNLDNTFINYSNGTLSLFSEDKVDGMTVGSSVLLEIPTEGSSKDFSVCLDTDRLLALVKKLYDGVIKIDFRKDKVVFKEGNIKASFGTISAKRRYSVPSFVEIDGLSKDWIVSRLVDCLSSIAETSKKNPSGKMLGILFDTSNGVSRICKFSHISLYLSTASAIFAKDFRLILPDVVATLAKSFSKSVESVLLSDNVAGFKLSTGTKVWTPKPTDGYPKDYLTHLELYTEGKLLSEEASFYQFDVNSLINSLDLVATVLGPSDPWVHMSTIGKTGDNLVWRVAGKNYKGTEIHEDILSNDGAVVEKFSVNKDRALKALSLFDDTVRLYNLSPSVLAFSDSEGDRVALLVKARI